MMNMDFLRIILKVHMLIMPMMILNLITMMTLVELMTSVTPQILSLSAMMKILKGLLKEIFLAVSV